MFLIGITPKTLFSQNLEIVTEKFSDYSSYKQHLLSAMASAKDKVWIATRSFSDGDFSTAFYLAKYKHLKTKIFLSLEKQRQHISQSTWIQIANIETQSMDEVFFKNWATILLVDQSLYFANHSLDLPIGDFDYEVVKNTQKDTVEEFTRFLAKYKNGGLKKVDPLQQQRLFTQSDPDELKKLRSRNPKKTSRKKLPSRLPQVTKWQKKKTRKSH